MMQQKILHILNYSPRGHRAIDHFLLEFSAQARERNWEVRYAFSNRPSDDFAHALAQLGVRWHLLAFPLTWKSISSLGSELAGFRPTVTQFSFISAFTPAVLLWKLTRHSRHVIVLDHSSGAVPPRGRLHTLLRRIRGWLTGCVVDAIAPVSEFIARRDREEVFLPSKKIRVIPNGIDLNRMRFRVREDFETVRIAYAGQLIAAKGVDTLIAAVRSLVTVLPGELELRIAGTGSAEASLRALASDLKEVQFLGFLDHISTLFEWADIVVVPSRWAEAFGLVAIEAMATGAAVIVSDAGALPEVVADAGLVFHAEDAQDLASCLQNLIRDRNLRKQLGQKARARVESQYALKNVVAQHCALCQQLGGRQAGLRIE